MKIEKLLIAITFHYNEERLSNLSKISKEFKSLANNVKTIVITNTSDELHQKKIYDVFNMGFRYSYNIVKAPREINDVELFVPNSLSDPYLLTWCDFDIFRNYFNEDSSITHFMYLEDDMLIQPNNIEYWLKGRVDLKSVGLIPSFCRYELRPNSNQKYHVDNYHISMIKKFEELKSFSISDTYAYVNLIEPYHGMYLMDRELIEEHLFKKGNKIFRTYHGLREQAAAGLTYTNIPKNFSARYTIGFDKIKRQIDPDVWIHHTANNYTNNPKSIFGKIKADNLII